MADLYVAGWTLADIARPQGVTEGAIAHAIKEATGMKPGECRMANGWGSLRTPPAETERIRQAVAGGVYPTVEALADAAGVPVSTVQAVVRNLGLEPRFDRRQVALDVDAIAQAYRDEGLNTAQLAERYGVNEKTIRRRLNEAKVARSGRGPSTPDEDALPLVLEAWAQEPTLNHVMEQVGLGYARVRRLLAAGGIPEEDFTCLVRHLTDEEEAEVVRRYREIPNISAIADDFGVGFETVRRVVVAAGLVVNTPRSLTDEERDLIVRRYRDEAASVMTIVYEMGANRMTVTRVLRAHGLEVQPPHTRVHRPHRTDDEVRSELVAAWAETPTVSHVARRCRIDRTRAARLLAEEGLRDLQPRT